MPITMTTATVYQWEVDPKANPPAVKVSHQAPVSMKLGDRSNNADYSPLMAQYILNLNPKDVGEYEILVTAMRDSMLTVVGVNSQQIIPPPLPVQQ